MTDRGGEREPDRSGSEVLLTLPDDLRGAFKDPFGTLYTDATRLVDELGEPVLAVGDVVTRHLTRTGARPDLAVVDWVTEREELEDDDRPDVAGYDARYDVENPAAALTDDLLRALRAGLDTRANAVVVVDGEEDLAALPVLAVAPDGASVVYGQPGEGMVHVLVDCETRERARGLLARMDGDHERAYDAVGVE